MVEKITLEELIEEVYQDQLDLLKESELSPKERNSHKEVIKESLLECENMDDLFAGLKKLGYPQVEANEYIFSFFIES